MKLPLLLLSLLVIHISSQSTTYFNKSIKLYSRLAGQKVTARIYDKNEEHATLNNTASGISSLCIMQQELHHSRAMA